MIRFLYVCLLRLHPRQFRQRFAGEMLWIFDQAVEIRDRLVTDAVVSLWRQWALRPHTGMQPATNGATALRAVDGVPVFYTCESFMPRRSALLNGGVLSVMIFIGLYFTMAHWTSHAASTRLIGSHHHSRSQLLEVRSPTVAPTDLNTEIKVKLERGKPKDVWSQMLWLLSSSPLPSPSQEQRMDQKQADAGRKRAARAPADGTI